MICLDFFGFFLFVKYTTWLDDFEIISYAYCKSGNLRDGEIYTTYEVSLKLHKISPRVW